MKLHLIGLASLALTLSGHAAAVALDPELPAYAPAAPLDGALSLAGPAEMSPMVLRWMAIFNRAHPKVAFKFESKGPPSAPAGLIAGTAQIGYLGRRFKDAELADIIAKQGQPARQYIVAAGAYSDKDMASTLAVFVHPANPLKNLSLAQFDAIFSETRRRNYPHAITTWGQLGLAGEWADQPIRTYRMRADRGRLDFVTEVALLDGKWKTPTKEIPTHPGGPGPDAPDRGDDLTVAAVGADRYGMGVAGLGYVSGAVRSLALATADAGPFYPPTLENVASRRYPLSRLVFIYVNDRKQLEPVIREFLRVALSREGQQAALEEGYLPLSAEVVRSELSR